MTYSCPLIKESPGPVWIFTPPEGGKTLMLRMFERTEISEIQMLFNYTPGILFIQSTRFTKLEQKGKASFHHPWLMANSARKPTISSWSLWDIMLDLRWKLQSHLVLIFSWLWGRALTELALCCNKTNLYLGLFVSICKDKLGIYRKS